jgi:hypothetical protein
MKRIMQIWVLPALLFSCERTIEIDLGPHEPRLVLHGYVATGEFFHVAINKTMRPQAIISGDETFVENAWVTLYENDVFVDSLKYDAQKKRYSSQTVLAGAGKTYRVIAGANGFTTIEATANAAFPVNTVSIVHNKKTRSNSSNDMLDDVLFSFNDAANEKNYYLAALYPSLWARSGVPCIYTNDAAIDRMRGAVLPFDEGSCIDPEEILFSDKSFNGQLKEIAVSARTEGLKTETDTAGRLHRPYLKRSVISKEHYEYLQHTLSLYAGGVIPSLNEPVAIKGNVKNGYGLFAVFPVTTDTLR